MAGKVLLPFILLLVIGLGACNKSKIEDNLKGAWVEVDPATYLDASSGCEFVVGEKNVTMCGSEYIFNVSNKVKVYAKDGQIWYKEKIAYITNEEYIFDYDFENEYLWVKEETTDAKTNASINGRLFRKQ